MIFRYDDNSSNTLLMLGVRFSAVPLFGELQWAVGVSLNNLSDTKVPPCFWLFVFVSLTFFWVFLRRTQARSVSLLPEQRSQFTKNTELSHWCRGWDLTCLSNLLSGVQLNAAQSQSGAERSFQFHFLPFYWGNIGQFWSNRPQRGGLCRVMFRLARLTQQGRRACRTKLQNSLLASEKLSRHLNISTNIWIDRKSI